MASNYGLNFGFRRSDETLRVSAGRYRTPLTGAPLLIGTAVEIDPANPGFLRVPAAGTPARPGTCGVLVQEEDFLPSIYEVSGADSFSKGVAKKGRLSVISTGAGSKVWFKNTTAQSRWDGRQVPGVNLVDLAGASVGDFLGWNGTRWAVVADEATAHMEITELDTAKGYCEAVYLR